MRAYPAAPFGCPSRGRPPDMEQPQCHAHIVEDSKGWTISALVMLRQGRLTRGDSARAAALELPDNGAVGVIENRVFDEIRVGDTASLVRTLSREDIEDFAGWGCAMIAQLLATRLPGLGTTYVEQTLRFRRPVTIGEAITATVTATAKNAVTSRVTFECRCLNQAGAIVVDGTTEVVAPVQKMSRAEPVRQH